MQNRFWKLAGMATVVAFISATAYVRSEPPKGGKSGGTTRHGAKSSGNTTETDNKGGPEIGKPAPDFTLKNYDGKEYKLADLKDKIVVLEWYNINCPVCKGYTDRMKEWAAKYAEKGVVWLAIDSTNNGSDSANEEYAKKHKVTYPILNDFDGKIGHAYKASTTPHMFVINKGTLVYAGAIDDSKGHGTAKKNYVSEAVDSVMASKPVAVTKAAPFGCSVKYKGKA